MTLSRLLAVLGLAVSFVVLSPAPSFACSCAQSGTDGHVAMADVVVGGTIESRSPSAGVAETVTYAVTVSEVYKGSAAATIVVRSSGSGASCGLENIRLGTEYVVFAAADRDAGSSGLWANLCGGTAPASPALLAEVERITGAPSAPEASPAPAAGGQPAAAVPRAQAVWPWGAGLLLLGAVAVVGALRRRRP